ncbi:unnamed protein product [Rhodiola kirilowii]
MTPDYLRMKGNISAHQVRARSHTRRYEVLCFKHSRQYYRLNQMIQGQSASRSNHICQYSIGIHWMSMNAIPDEEHRLTDLISTMYRISNLLTMLE